VKEQRMEIQIELLFIPNNQKLAPWSVPNHSLKVEELKGNIVTNKKA